MTTAPDLPRRLGAEFLGSAFLAAIVIGSGIAAQRLSPSDTGLELLENAAATAITIGRMFSNSFAGIAPSSAPVFIAAQVGGGIAGVLIISLLYPALTPAQAAGIVVPHEAARTGSQSRR